VGRPACEWGWGVEDSKGITLFYIVLVVILLRILRGPAQRLWHALRWVITGTPPGMDGQIVFYAKDRAEALAVCVATRGVNGFYSYVVQDQGALWRVDITGCPPDLSIGLARKCLGEMERELGAEFRRRYGQDPSGEEVQFVLNQHVSATVRSWAGPGSAIEVRGS